MDPPRYVDVEECQEKYHRAKNRSNSSLVPEHPRGPVERWELDWEGAVACGAVFEIGVGAWCKLGGKRWSAGS